MQITVKPDLKRLCDLALELGASNARAFAANDVVIDERVRLKCHVPICDDYGTNLMCPPHLGLSISDFAQILSRYHYAVLLQVNSQISQDMLQLVTQEHTHLTDLYQNSAFMASYNNSFVRARKTLHEIVNRVEAAAFSMGYRFTTGFIGGSCRLCAKCVAHDSNEPCRNPFKARPSMEAVGIDVFQTAKNAGLPFDIPPKANAVWNGLLLIE